MIFLKQTWYILFLTLLSVVVNFIFLSPLWAGVASILTLLLSGIAVGAVIRMISNQKTGSELSDHIAIILRDVPIAIVAYDTDFTIRLFNPAAEELFSLRSSDVLLKKLDASQASDASLRVLVQTVFSSLAPTVVKLSDPGVFPHSADISFQDPSLDIHVITDRIIDARGRVVGFVKLITNLTREHDLLKSKTEFIGIAAHQLRTPLTAVNWAIEALESSPLNDDQKQFLDTAYAAVKNSLNTVNSLLDVSKIEEGKFGYDFQITPLLSFLDSVLVQAYDLGKQYNINVYFDRPKTDWRVRVDAQKLSMVFYNLLDNAIKYNVEHGSVTVGITLDSDNAHIVVSIRDTGIGIPPEQVSKLFTKFFRADNAIKAVGDGNGLGLYIARNIVRAHGGDIRVESELNRGTTFFVTLPIVTS
jgi:signal transduction histidine kinase